jgi:hypothetical protein
MSAIEPFDYEAEVARSREAQGLPAEIPEHLWEAVEALLLAAELDVAPQPEGRAA